MEISPLVLVLLLQLPYSEESVGARPNACASNAGFLARPAHCCSLRFTRWLGGLPTRKVRPNGRRFWVAYLDGVGFFWIEWGAEEENKTWNNRSNRHHIQSGIFIDFHFLAALINTHPPNHLLRSTIAIPRIYKTLQNHHSQTLDIRGSY